MHRSDQPPSEDRSGVQFDPPRLLESGADLSPFALGLLSSPPLVKPLDPNVAMRVRSAVLQGPVAPSPLSIKGRGPSSAHLKLGFVAGSAALVGAGLATLAASQWYASGALGQGRHSVVVVSGADLTSVDAPGRSTPGHSVLGQSEGGRLRDGQRRESWDPSLQRRGSGEELGAREAAPLASLRGDSYTGRSVDGASRVAMNDAEGHRRSTADQTGTEVNAGGEVLSVADLQTVDETLRARGGVRQRTLSGDRKRSGDGEQDLGGAQIALDSAALTSRTTLEAEATFELGDEAAETDGTRVRVRPEFRRLTSSASAQQVPSRAGRPPLASTISTLEEETLLLEEARSRLGRDPERALELALDHQRRFRRGQLLEQRRMIHLEALLRLGRDEEAMTLAKSIGNSLYRARAQTLLDKYGL